MSLKCEPALVQVSYCDDHYECRRKLQLEYFGENDFDAKLCNGICPSIFIYCVKNNYFAEMYSGSEEGSYLRLIDFYITQL